MQYGCEVDRKTEFWSYVRHSVIIIRMHTRNALYQRMEKYRKVKGQPTKQLAHLLPGYLFFVSDHPQELQKLLKRIPEFAKTLGDDDGAIPLYQEEVEFLQRYTGEERILKMSEGYLVGSELVVTDGPLKDYQGKVMKIDRHKRTAVLELEFLGRKTKVTVGLEVVRKV